MQHVGRILRRALTGVSVAAAMTVGALAGLPATASAAGAVTCQQYRIPVALAAGQRASYETNGELCATPAELSSGETIQLLIHGATYNHTYWDFGTINGVQYSYARDLAADGYPTFAIDEIGTTDTKPIVPSTDVTLSSVAYVAHQIVQDLLAGRIAGVSFGKVMEVGHSQGSATTWEEAGTYHDVAGVIITGATHAAEFAQALAGFSPAILDPHFSGVSGIDAGYLTTPPGRRASLFYASSDSDPAVIAQDEATKNILSSTLLANDPLILVPTISQQINVPVLVLMGGDDSLFCSVAGVPEVTTNCSSGQALATDEGPYYSAAAHLRACVVSGAGHDINLALNHDVEERDALAWSKEYVGQLGAGPDTSRTLPADCSS